MAEEQVIENNEPQNSYTLLDFSSDEKKQQWSFMDIPDPKNKKVEDDLLMTNKTRKDFENKMKNEHWSKSSGPIRVIKKNY